MHFHNSICIQLQEKMIESCFKFLIILTQPVAFLQLIFILLLFFGGKGDT